MISRSSSDMRKDFLVLFVINKLFLISKRKRKKVPTKTCAILCFNASLAILKQ